VVVSVLLLVDCAVCARSPVDPMCPGLGPVWGLKHPQVEVMPTIGVTAINGDPSCGNIWITGVCWRYL
jgi:hypothetical protein